MVTISSAILIYTKHPVSLFKMRAYIQYLTFTLIQIVAGYQAFSQVNACITFPSTTTDTAICKWTWINLTADDCSNPNSSNTSYSWQNMNDPWYPYGTTYAGKTFATQDTGRWEVTVTNDLDMSEDKAIVHVRYKQPNPDFSINNHVPFERKCPNASVTLNATTNANFTNYRWYKAGSSTPLSTTNSYTVSSLPSPTDYLVTALNTATGCTLIDSIHVVDFVSSTPDLGNDISVCSGQPVKLSVKGLSSPASAYSFSWQGGAFGSDSSHPVTIGGKYVVSVQGPFPSPCIVKDSINVTLIPAPTINTVPPTIICYGNNLLLNVLPTGSPGPFSYKWSPGDSINNINIQSPTVNPISNTTYTVEVTDLTTSCISKGTRVINVNPEIKATVNFTDSTICPGDVVQLHVSATGGTGALNYSWTPNSYIQQANTQTPLVNPASPVSYIATVKDSRSCSTSVAVHIDILHIDLPGADDTLAILGDSVMLNAFNPSTQGFSFSWKDEAGNEIGTDPVFYAKVSGIYTVHVYNNNCMVSDSKEVLFAAQIVQKIYIPNVFNPSLSHSPHDSHLRVYGNNVSDDNFSFKVYNQWGDIVYEASSFSEAHSNGWNGRYNNSGQDLSRGVYTYTVSGQFYNGNVFENAGMVNLIR